MDRIIAVMYERGFAYPYCVGNSVKEGFTCQAVEYKGKQYQVNRYDLMQSISGRYAVVLQVETEDTFEPGEIAFITGKEQKGESPCKA